METIGQKKAAGFDANTQKVINVVDPTADQDAATKKYVDNHFLTAAPSADVTASGLTCTLNANENQAFGDVVYINADGQAQLGDADAIASSVIVAMAIETISADADGKYLLQGFARKDAWSWTVGGKVYLSLTGTSTNTLTQTAPSATDDCIVEVGVATHADRIYFNPTIQGIVEHA